MNPQPSGMTVPADSRMGMDEGWAEGAANADWSGGGIDWRNQDIYTVKPQSNIQKQVEDYSALAPMYGNFIKGAGGAFADIGRSWLWPPSWRWGKDESGDPVKYDPAFQPDQSDSMAQRAGYELIDAMPMGLPTGAPDFESMTDADIALQMTDLVDPSGLGGDVAKGAVKLAPKIIDFDTVASTLGVLSAKGKDLLKNSKAVDANGQPLVLYHGSKTGWVGDFDPTKEVEYSLYGPGVYLTENPLIAGGSLQNSPKTPGYSFLGLWSGKEGPNIFRDYPDIKPTVRRNYIDVRNPIDMNTYNPEVTNLLYDELLNTTSRVASNNPIDVQKREYFELLADLAAQTSIDPKDHKKISGIIASGNLKDSHEPLKQIMHKVFADNDQAYMFTINKMAKYYGRAGIGKGMDAKGYAQSEIQEIFKIAGYDSITHLGGARTGQEKLHRVYIVFSDFYERHGKPRGNLTQKDLDAMTPSEIDQLWADSDWVNYNVTHSGRVTTDADDIYASYFDRIVNWPDAEIGGVGDLADVGKASGYDALHQWKQQPPGYQADYYPQTNLQNLLKAIEDAP